MAGTHEWDGKSLLLRLHIQPRASRNEWAGEHGDALKLRITAPPVDGKANAHIERWLAVEFGVNRSAITLLSGDSSRRKRYRIDSPARLPRGIEPANGTG